MKVRLSVMLFISLALHGWLLWAAPAPVVDAPGGTVALKLGQLRLAPQPQPAARPVDKVVPKSTPPTKTPVSKQPAVQKKMVKTVAEIEPRKAVEPQKPAPVAVESETASRAEKAQPAPDADDLQVATAPQSSQQSVSEAPVLVERPAFASPPSAPQYPDLARQRRQQGTVVVEVQLDRSGAQVMRKLLQSSGVDSLDEAALAAVAGWEFLPYRENGRAHLSRVRLPIRFSL